MIDNCKRVNENMKVCTKNKTQEFIPIEILIETENELQILLEALNYGRGGDWPARDAIFNELNIEAEKQGKQYKK
jgi:hypothetical protein